MRIGIDFDNTLVCYDEAFVFVGKQEQLLPVDFPGNNKTQVRDYIRELENGEYHWQRLQGLVYGKLIEQARLFEGVEHFIQKAIITPDIQLYIISHKTELAHHDPDKTNLRQAALGFLQNKGVFSAQNFTRNHVYFGATREEKIEHIKRLKCEVFIDDLAEVLTDPAFPTLCRRILFAPQPEHNLFSLPSWAAIEAHLLP